MPELKFSPQADRDAARIWHAIAVRDFDAANRLVKQILDRAESLVRFPEIGPERPDLGRDLRVLVVRRYLIVYRFDQPLDDVHVVRILEGERDLTDLF